MRFSMVVVPMDLPSFHNWGSSEATDWPLMIKWNGQHAMGKHLLMLLSVPGLCQVHIADEDHDHDHDHEKLEEITHYYVSVDKEECKFSSLCDLHKTPAMTQSVIITNTRRKVGPSTICCACQSLRKAAVKDKTRTATQSLS